MKQSILMQIVLIVFCNSICFAITEKQFNSIITIIQDEKFESAYKQIQEVKKNNPKDPEYFVLAVNYYYMKSQTNYVNMVAGQPTKDSVLILQDTATGEPIGYIDDTTIFDMDTLELGISVLKRGLILYPNRLDMHFGLITITEAAGLYEEMADAIISVLNKSKKYGDNWLWSFSEPYGKNATGFILEGVQNKLPNLMKIGKANTDSLSEAISLAQVENYPESVYGFANLGTLHLMKGELDKSLPWLLDAIELAPNDGIVIVNLANLYLAKGEKEKVIEYLKLLLEVGTPDEQEFAKEQLKILG